ncbi:MAG: sigma-70 family RNA polymerase sigma factor [Candidatus Pseudobacter hemicellulosilyticus]|uniref:Sigma-70 family RNA polymerase sigma factor n=1 Tax=Candidatus Pseudobacter hemicellulosilyticus TaxID=3121375 RepID=A0AAJ6BFD7_9BACT|nr:MAG: sigma-70 family RNA polymerase sigma factor [Pseudobacter sp.]
MDNTELIPGLFRTEYRNIVSVLCRLFGIEHIEIAEDIVSDTFLTATETWWLKGTPENPKAWLYTVAKNKTKNYLKRHSLFEQRIATEIRKSSNPSEEIELDLSPASISDSQLAMMFTVCHPALPKEAQTALALHLLCGFGVQEIADAYLTNREVVYKRISRAKEKLKSIAIRIEAPSVQQAGERLDSILTTLYLLFSEGYYSRTHHSILRKELCTEAIRLTEMLLAGEATARPETKALLALMCFHASRLEARSSDNGEAILYKDQDTSLWDQQLISKGIHYLNLSANGSQLSRYHLEAAIAYWHTHKEDSPAKWEEILQLYNQLLQLQYSPIAALNRTFALARVYGKERGIQEAEKLQLTSNPFYYSLLGNLYTGINNATAITHYERALALTRATSDRQTISRNIAALTGQPDANIPE